MAAVSFATITAVLASLLSFDLFLELMVASTAMAHTTSNGFGFGTLHLGSGLGPPRLLFLILLTPLANLSSCLVTWTFAFVCWLLLRISSGDGAGGLFGRISGFD